MGIEIVEIDSSNDSKGVSTPSNKVENVVLNDNNPRQLSTNFGGGVEMLMNDKKKSNTPKSSNSGDIDIQELTKLENELNDLTKKPSKSEVTNSVYNTNIPKINSNNETKLNVNNDDNIKLNTNTPPSLKLNTNNHNPEVKPKPKTFSFLKTDPQQEPQKTWDGFSSFSDLNNENKYNSLYEKEKAPLTKEETLKQKFEYLKKLEQLERKGAELSKKYSMDSNLDEMIGEYETLIDEKERQNSVKFQSKILMACVTGLEFLNSKFDPFDIKLDGWAESVNENMDDYDEIFSELHEKYRSKAKMAPELKLLFQLGGSAIMLHMTNTMFKSSLPGMDDIMRQNPELMQQFTKAAVNTMGQSQPGFGSFMNGIIDNEYDNNSYSTTTPPMGSPPGSYHNQMQEKNDNNIKSRLNTMQKSREELIPPTTSRRQDIGMSRGIASFDDAEDLNNTYESVEKSKRPDMKGPRDIKDILSGLKTKSVNINNDSKYSSDENTVVNKSKSQSQSQTRLQTQTNKDSQSFFSKNIMSNSRKTDDFDDVGSTISLDDFQSLKGSGSAKQPTKSRRRNRSEKTTVSLNI